MIESGTWTVLFTDIVASTELRSRLGDDEADVQFAAIDAAVATAVERHHGVLVKGLGDGHMATFRGAADAIGAGVAIQQAAAGAGALMLRVGISAGRRPGRGRRSLRHPGRRGGAALRRRAVRSDPGDVARARTGGTRGGYEFESVGPLTLKGLSDPVEAYAVVWAPLDAASLGRPAVAADVRRPAELVAFVGRSKEVDQLRSAWQTATGAQPHARVVMLSGEPGIGKTRMAAQLAREVYGDGAMVLLGRCEEELGVALPTVRRGAPLRHRRGGPRSSADAARPQSGRARASRARARRGVARRRATHHDPTRRPSATGCSTQSWIGSRRRATSGPSSSCSMTCIGRAGPTLLLLNHIVRSERPIRVLVVGTYRDTDRRAGTPVGRHARGLPPARSGGALLVARPHHRGRRRPASGRTPGTSRVPTASSSPTRLRDETEGNPFFIVEVLRHLAESGAVFQRDGRWAIDVPIDRIGIPEGVRDVVGRRLGRLSAMTNDVLEGGRGRRTRVRSRRRRAGERPRGERGARGNGVGCRRQLARRGEGRSLAVLPRARTFDAVRGARHEPPSAPAPDGGRDARGSPARRLQRPCPSLR